MPTYNRSQSAPRLSNFTVDEDSATIEHLTALRQWYKGWCSGAEKGEDKRPAFIESLRRRTLLYQINEGYSEMIPLLKEELTILEQWQQEHPTDLVLRTAIISVHQTLGLVHSLTENPTTALEEFTKTVKMLHGLKASPDSPVDHHDVDEDIKSYTSMITTINAKLPQLVGGVQPRSPIKPAAERSAISTHGRD